MGCGEDAVQEPIILVGEFLPGWRRRPRTNESTREEGVSLREAVNERFARSEAGGLEDYGRR